MGQTNSLVYAVPVGEKKEGESHIYRNPTHVNNLLDNFNGETTVQGLFLRSCRLFPNNKCIGKQNLTGQNSRHYTYKTYKEVQENASQLGSGIINLNLIPNPQQYEGQQLRMIGIFSKNREEWLILDLANTLYGNTMIPLYETLGMESLPYIFQQTQISTLFVSNSSAETLLKVSNYHELKNIVTLDILSPEFIQRFEEKGIKVLNYSEVLAAGQQKLHPYAQVSAHDIFTFSYTSGTTGMPKGVMLRHINFVSVTGGVVYQGVTIAHTDVYLSYLPLPHVLERFVVTTLLGYGATICMYGGDVQKLNIDLQLVKPTVFMGVPRLYQRFYNVIKEKLDKLQGFQKRLFEQALSTKLYHLRNGGHVTHKLWDRLVFEKTKQAFGGKVRYMMSGSAPMSSEVIDFLKCVVCAPFIEGYGQTEGCGGSFITKAEDPSSGHVGGVFSNIEFKVMDVPQMNYFSTDIDHNQRIAPRGEICIRGNAIFAGYYKEPEKTKEAIDADGWLHSGDIGIIRPDGSLKIIDRVKNIFKLSQGEYIAPEKLEGIYLRTKGINEVFVYGDSGKSFCVAFVVPDKQYVIDLGQSLGVNGQFEELCKNEIIIKSYLDSMVKQGKLEKLNGLEIVKKVYLEPVSFIIHGLTSNTLKLMRHKARDHFQNQINQLYKGSE